MFEQVTPTVRYAKAPTAIGVVTHGDRALLVDSGLDENLVRKVMNALANEGVTVAAVVNTHAHADHCGGNHFVCKRAPEARVVAPHYEHFFIERPDLEPYTLFGAPGPSALRGKFLQAAPSRVDEAVEGEGVRDVAGFRVRFHALPGHSVRQMGVEVDGVLFVGDAILPPAVMEKYGLVFAVDPLEMRRSAERVLEVAPSEVVAYHGGRVDDLQAAVAANARLVAEVEARIGGHLARGPATAEDVMLDLMDRFPPSHATLELHALNSATVRGYLSALERAGRAEAFLEKGRVLWRLRGGC